MAGTITSSFSEYTPLTRSQWQPRARLNGYANKIRESLSAAPAGDYPRERGKHRYFAVPQARHGPSTCRRGDAHSLQVLRKKPQRPTSQHLQELAAGVRDQG